MLFAAATKGLSMAEVLHWLDSREVQEVKDILEAAGDRGCGHAYKVVEVRESLAGGKMSGGKLEKLLNEHASRAGRSRRSPAWT